MGLAMKSEDGAWAAETGPAVTSGGGLLVVVDEEHSLHLFAPENQAARSARLIMVPQRWQSAAGGANTRKRWE